MLIVPVSGQGVLALDSDTGKVKWNYQAPMTVCSTPVLDAQAANIFVACDGQDSTLLSIAVESGDYGITWTRQIAGLNTLGVGVSKDAIFFAWTWAGKGTVVSVDVSGGSGDQRWSSNVGVEVEARVQVVPTLCTGPICDPPSVIATDLAGVVRRMDAATGATKWKVTPGDLASCGHYGPRQCLSIMSNAAFAKNGTQVVLPVEDGADHGSLYCLDIGTGSTVWSAGAGGDLRASTSGPVVNKASTVVFIGTGSPAQSGGGGGNIVLVGGVAAFAI